MTKGYPLGLHGLCWWPSLAPPTYAFGGAVIPRIRASPPPLMHRYYPGCTRRGATSANAVWCPSCATYIAHLILQFGSKYHPHIPPLVRWPITGSALGILSFPWWILWEVHSCTSRPFSAPPLEKAGALLRPSEHPPPAYSTSSFPTLYLCFFVANHSFLETVEYEVAGMCLVLSWHLSAQCWTTPIAASEIVSSESPVLSALETILLSLEEKLK
jgi:hypothetical protein